MKKKIGLLTIIALLVSFMAFSGVASAQSSNVQVVFFTSPLCGVCQQVKPLAEAAANKYGVSITYVNAADQGSGQGIATANGVSETPTIVITGAQSARLVGYVSQAQIEAAIKAAIGNATPTPQAPTVVKQAVATVNAPAATVKAPAATVKAPAATVKAATVVKQAVATVKADPTKKQVTAVKAVAVTTAKQPTIEVVTAKQTSTTATQTVPEFSLLGLGAPALLVGAIYLFLRRR
ncbi:MAG: thioredoxin domain-containing protein [Halobacteriota archaeon]